MKDTHLQERNTIEKAIRKETRPGEKVSVGAFTVRKLVSGPSSGPEKHVT